MNDRWPASGAPDSTAFSLRAGRALAQPSRALAACLIFACTAAAQTYHGEPLAQERYGPAVIEPLAAVLARDAQRPVDELVNPKARGGRHGEWTVPPPLATFMTCSGQHSVVNEWGDTRMGIGFKKAARVHGAFVAGQAGPGAWARAVRVHGFRHGEPVQQTDWLEIRTPQPQWFEMNLFDVERIEIEARPAFGHSGWYALDDLTWTPLDDPQGLPRVVTFEDCAYGQKLTASGYAGLDWELGQGPIDGDEGVPAPRVAPEARKKPDGGDSPPKAAGGAELGGGPSATLPELTFDFQGVIRGDAGSLTFPPDTCGAIGPGHFVEVVNRNFAVYDRFTGQELANVLLSSFLPGSNGDPRVLYDQHSSRWIVMVTDFSATEKIFLAVSLTPDATDLWFKTDFQTDLGTDSGCWPDYPTLGVDASGLYVAAFMVGCGMTIFAVDKAPLLEPEPALGIVTAFRNLPFEGAIQPVHTYGPSPGEYFISRQSASQLRLRRLDGPLNGPTMSEVGSIVVPAHDDPPDVPSLGGLTPIDTVDARLMNAVFRDGSIWTAHTIDVGGRAGCRWYEIDAEGLNLSQSGSIEDHNLDYFFPAIAVNANRGVVVGFSGASADQYVAAYYTGRVAQDPPGQMALPAIVKEGLAAQNNIDQFGRNRWGDYSLATVDPADDVTLWSIQEYAHDEDIWGTWIAALAPVQTCSVAASCADGDQNGVRDDACVWWGCDGRCLGTGIAFADMGGPLGACAPDGAADLNDRFHALNCFSNQDTSGIPGQAYPCEDNPPQAFNVDAGGSVGSCAPDGVCDANDAFHALNAFSGVTSCSCPPAGPGPVPATPAAPATVSAPARDGTDPDVSPDGGAAPGQFAPIELRPSRVAVGPGETVELDVYLAAPLPDLRGYQLHLGASGGQRGHLQLVDIFIREPVADLPDAVNGAFNDYSELGTWNSELAAWSAFNIKTHQMAAGLDGPGVAAPTGAYLATFTYRASSDAAGRFVVELLHDPDDRTQRTFLFATSPSAEFRITSAPAVIDLVTSRRAR